MIERLNWIQSLKQQGCYITNGYPTTVLIVTPFSIFVIHQLVHTFIDNMDILTKGQKDDIGLQSIKVHSNRGQ